MNIFTAYIRRSRMLWGILSLVLALGTAFGSLGVQSWSTTQQQLKQLDGQYTTIAVPGSEEHWIRYLSMEDSDGRRAVAAAPGFEKLDSRGMLGAHIPGTRRLTSFETEDHLNNASNRYNTHLIVLAARCDSVEPGENEAEYVIMDENGNESRRWTEIFCGYEANFTVLDTLIRNDAYKLYPLETVVTGGLFTSDLKIPFTAGKTYLLLGMTHGFATDIDVSTGECRYVVNEAWTSFDTLCYDHGQGTLLEESLLIEGGDVESDGKFYGAMSPGQLPIYQEYEGDLQTFLASEEGRLWREIWIPMCRRNYESANVMLTDDLYSILDFNNGTASILDGRDFTREDYDTGADVCIVSSAYAQKNGLSLGDRLHMELYTCESALGMSWVQSGFSVDTRMLHLFEPLKEENKLDLQKDYTIVGIYSAPEFPVSIYSFDANTILVPRRSIPGADAYDKTDNSLLSSVVLKNGTGEAFLEDLAARGHENVFEICDMGYAAAAGSLLAARENALRLLVMGLAVFLMSGVLFFVIALQRLKGVIRSMRHIGVAPAGVLGQLLTVLLGSAACAAAVGTALSAALFGRISSSVLAGGMALSAPALLLCALAQLVFLAVFGVGASAMAANRNLMQRR